MKLPRVSRPILLRIVKVCAALSAVALLSLWLLLFTGLGTRLMLGLLRNRMAPAVTIEAMHGPLRGPLEILGIQYQGERASAVVDTVRVNWRLSRLLKRMLDVELLEISGVTVVLHTAPVADSAEATQVDGEVPFPPDFTLPVNLHLPRGVVYRLAVNRSDDSILTAMDSLTVAVVTRGDSITVERVNILGPDLWVSLDGAVRTNGAYPMSFQADWNLLVRGISAAGRGRVSGDLAHLELWHETSEPVSSEIVVEIDSALTTQTFTASVSVADFDISDFDSTQASAILGADLRAAGTPSAFTSTANLRVEHTSVGLATPRLSITRSGETFHLDSLDVSFRGSPARLTGRGEIVLGEGERTFDGVLDWRRMGWPFLDKPQVTSEGQVHAIGTIDAYTLEAQATFAGARIAPGSMAVAGRGSRDSLVVRGGGEGFGGRFLVESTAQLRPLIGWVAALEVDSVDLTALLPDTVSWVRDLTVALRTEGKQIDTGFSGSIQLTRLSGLLKGTPFHASAGAQLIANGMQIDSAHATLLDGEIWTEGTVSWTPRVEWQLTSRATGINPAPLMTNSTLWPGSLSATATLAGSRSPGGFEASAQVDTVSGELRGEPLSAKFAGAVIDSTYRIDSLALEWGTIKMAASGELGEEVIGNVDFLAPDLSLAVPDAGGSLRAEVNIAGTRSAPHISGMFDATNLSYLDYGLAKLTGTGGFDFARNGSFDFILGGESLTVRDRTIDTLSMTVVGVREDHEIAALVSEGGRSVTLAAVGGLNTTTWLGNLESLQLFDSVAGTWSLETSTGLLAARDSAAFADPFCMTSADARFCAEGYWNNGGPWRITADASAIPLDRFKAFFPQSFDIAGSLDGNAEFCTTTDGALEGTARIGTSRGTIRYAVAGNRQTLTHDRGMVSIDVGADGVQTSMGVVLEDVGPNATTFAEVAGSLALPSFHPLSDSLLPQRIDGTLRMMVSDLSAVEAIYPQVVSVEGSVAADLTIGGTVREPLVLGEATLRNGSADIPTLGLELRNAEGTAVGRGVAGISLTGSVESGTGRIEMTGTMKASQASDSILRLQLVGARVLAVNTPEVQLWASPNLNITVGKSEVSVDGDVMIPRAQIDLPEIPALAVRASRDAIIVSDTTLESVSVIDTRARLRVLLGDSVSFRGFGFAGRPTGNLLVIDVPGQATVATGQLTIVEGRYRAYGQDLTIETGRAIYAGGPVDNPGLDVRATRRARDEDVVAGLEVKGTLKAPEITVFSEPPMLQSEALAYLVLGRPLSELTSSEGNRVTNAAMSLGIRGGNLLAQRVARRFGLDDAGIETEGSWEQASLYAGKYLSPKLYVSYGYGLFEAASLFTARYMLSRRWTLQAETGERTSTDIKYRIERGR